MTRLLFLVAGSTALAATLSLPAAAQEYSSGCEHKPCPVITTPVEAYGVHPPGTDCCCKHGTVVPYYAPLSPNPTCWRFRPIHVTPYYCGYCAHGHHGRKTPPHPCNGGWGPGPLPEGPGTPPFNYGPFTSVLTDDTLFWRMGGNGLVPYGTPQPPRTTPPDLVDMIQVARASGGCLPPVVDGGGPAIVPPLEKPAEKDGATDKEGKAAPPVEMLKMPASEKPMLPE
jgi:hypothetical protein